MTTRESHVERRQFSAGIGCGPGGRRSIFHVPSETALRQHFSLAQAEARLFLHLVAGLTIGECSEVLGLGTSTLRTGYRRILRKTGCHRQGELLRLATLLAP